MTIKIISKGRQMPAGIKTNSGCKVSTLIIVTWSSYKRAHIRNQDVLNDPVSHEHARLSVEVLIQVCSRDI